jgi:hypothetical protein
MAINQITLRVFQFAGGNELFTLDRELSVDPILGKRSLRAMNKDKTGELAVR